MTQRVALIGKPLKRRHSVVMHNAAFDAAGIDGRYELMEIDEDAVAAAVAAAHGEDWLGLGVTAPYKKVVAGLVDEVELDAREIGAVNNVVRTPEGRLLGFNTDSPGFASAVLGMGWPLSGANVVIAGAGGVAQAIAYACRQEGAASVTVGNRHIPASAAGIDAVALDSDEFRQALRNASLAVNATTMGMIDAGMAFDPALLAWGTAVFDSVYVPRETPLLAAARERGLDAINGEEMLIAQAAIAFERWTGVSGMAGVMREAVMPLFADAATVA